MRQGPPAGAPAPASYSLAMPTCDPHARRANTRAALATALLFGACAGAPVEVDPAFDFAAVETFAWKEEPRLAATEHPGDEGVLARLERGVERLLGRRGMRKTEKAEAQIVLSATLTTEVRRQAVDPIFATYVAEDYEYGRLVLEVFDRPQRRSVWVGDSAHKIRSVARVFGGLKQNLDPVDEPRSWRVDELVEDALASLPGAER